ncbi:hypothetical protein K0U27_09225 [archaeon]|nr:hypothetical protein [archaeon]
MICSSTKWILSSDEVCGIIGSANATLIPDMMKNKEKNGIFITSISGMHYSI